MEVVISIDIHFTNIPNLAKKIVSNCEICFQREKEIAEIYIKFMKKIIASGASFVKQESTRLEKILKEGKVNQKKKEELSQRSNILKSFVIKPEKSEL